MIVQLLLPKGALTSKQYVFKVRAWELNSLETVDLTDIYNNPVYLQYTANKIIRIVPKKNKNSGIFISDNCRFRFGSLTVPNSSSNQKFLGDVKNTVKNLIFGHKIKEVFIVDMSVDLSTLEVLKSIHQNTSSVLVRRSLNSFVPPTLFYWSEAVKRLESVTILRSCFVCSSVLNVEAIMLNVKLRLKYAERRFKFFNLGFYANSLFGVCFISLHLKYFINLVKSKNSLLLGCLLTVCTTVVVIGESVFRRLKKYEPLFNVFINKLPLVILYFISKFVNLEVSKIVMFKLLTRRIFTRVYGITVVGVEDTLQSVKVQKLSSSIDYSIILFVSFLTFFSKSPHKFHFIASRFESFGIYLNCEQKVIQTVKLPTASFVFVQVFLGSINFYLKNYSFLYYSNFRNLEICKIGNKFLYVVVELFKKYSVNKILVQNFFFGI